jgi:predicted DNA-binding protein
MDRAHGVSVRFSPELLARLDATASAWGLNRAATLRRLVELADVDAAPVVSRRWTS